MTKAIIYVRFSSKGQGKGTTVERQLDLCRSHIARNGWTEIEVVQDLGRSAWKGDHLSKGNLGTLAQRIRDGEVERGTIVLVEKLDRLSRLEVKRTQRWLEDLTEFGVGFATVDGNRLYTEETLRQNLMETMEILMRGKLAHDESQQKSERIRSAISIKRAEARRTGAIMHKRIPGWLSVEGDRFVVDDARAATILQIYQWSADGYGARVIARMLNERGVKSWGSTKGGQGRGWDPTFVSEIIMSIAVEGDYQPTTIIEGRKVPAGDPIVGYYQHRIVSADLVQRARAARASRRKTGGGHRAQFANLFSGMMKCGACQSSMTLRNGRTTRATVECGSVYRGRGCTQGKSIRFGRFEDRALDLILPLALDDRYFSRPTETLRLATQVADLEKMVADLTLRSKRLVNLMIQTDDPDPVMVSEQASLTRTISENRGRLEEAREALSSARGAVDAAEHLRRVVAVRDAIHSLDRDISIPARMKVHAALKGVVERIWVQTDDMSRGEPEATYDVTLVGCAVGWKIAAKTGEVIASYDLTGQGDPAVALPRGVWQFPNSAQRMNALLTRKAAIEKAA